MSENNFITRGEYSQLVDRVDDFISNTNKIVLNINTNLTKQIEFQKHLQISLDRIETNYKEVKELYNLQLNKISDRLEIVEKKIHDDETERKNSSEISKRNRSRIRYLFGGIIALYPIIISLHAHKISQFFSKIWESIV